MPPYNEPWLAFWRARPWGCYPLTDVNVGTRHLSNATVNHLSSRATSCHRHTSRFSNGSEDLFKQTERLRELLSVGCFKLLFKLTCHTTQTNIQHGCTPHTLHTLTHIASTCLYGKAQKGSQPSHIFIPFSPPAPLTWGWTTESHLAVEWVKKLRQFSRQVTWLR